MGTLTSSLPHHHHHHSNLLLRQPSLMLRHLTVGWALALAIVAASITAGLFLLQRHASARAERVAMEAAAAAGVEESTPSQAEGRRRRWWVEQVWTTVAVAAPDQRAILGLAIQLGMIASLLMWGVMQERIMTRPFESSGGEELFQSSLFLVMMNRFVSCLAAVTALLAGGSSLRPAAPITEYVVIAAANTASTSCQYEALKYVSFAVQTLGKSAKTIPTLVWTTVLSRRRPSREDLVLAAAVAVGCTVFLTSGEVRSAAAISSTAATPPISDGQSVSSDNRVLISPFDKSPMHNTSFQSGEANGRFDGLRQRIWDSESIANSTNQPQPVDIIDHQSKDRLLKDDGDPEVQYTGFEKQNISDGEPLNSGGGIGGGIEQWATLIGLVLMVLYLIIDGFTSSYQDRLFREFKGSTYLMMFYATGFGVLASAGALAVSGEMIPAFRFFLMHPDFRTDLAIMSVAATASQFFIYYTINHFGAFMFSTMMTTRQMLAIILSCIYFSNPISPAQMVSALVVFSAVYARSVLRRQQARSCPSTPRPSGDDSTGDAECMNQRDQPAAMKTHLDSLTSLSLPTAPLIHTETAPGIRRNRRTSRTDGQNQHHLPLYEYIPSEDETGNTGQPSTIPHTQVAHGSTLVNGGGSGSGGTGQGSFRELLKQLIVGFGNWPTREGREVRNWY